MLCNKNLSSENYVYNDIVKCTAIHNKQYIDSQVASIYAIQFNPIHFSMSTVNTFQFKTFLYVTVNVSTNTTAHQLHSRTVSCYFKETIG